MTNDSSDFIAEGTAPAAQWSRETSLYYLTRHQVGGRVLMRKSLKPQYLQNTRLRETLRKEYEIGSLIGMSTDSVVSYYQMVDTATECYLTMDFVEGLTLAEMAQQEPGYLCQKHNIERFLMQLLDGLQTMHHLQVVHLDLKPSNIMLTRVSHDVRIIDLGFCYSDAYQSSMGMTDEYAAPEQKDGSGDVDSRTDIYAVGKIVQWMSVTLGEQCRWRKSRECKHFLKRSLCDAKEDRWQTVAEIFRDLQKVRKKRHYLRTLWSSLAVVFVCVMAYLAYLRPVTGLDEHVLYGHFSIFSRTCEVIGKIQDDYRDTDWQGNLYVYPEVKHWGVKYNVVAIADDAFKEDSTFNTIWLPPTLKRIGSRAFRDSKNLEAINVPEGVEEIGPMAFFQTTSLAKVQFPATLHTIPENCFHRCPFTSITIPEGVTSIELDAFGYCAEMREIHLPKSLTRIARGVFWQCESLDSVCLPASLHSIGEYVFMGCKKLRQIENLATDPQPAMALFDHPTPEIRLLVPAESVDRYRQAQEWKELIIEPLSPR